MLRPPLWPTLRDTSGRRFPICRGSALPASASPALRALFEGSAPGRHFKAITFIIIGYAALVLFLIVPSPFELAAHTLVVLVFVLIVHHISSHEFAARITRESLNERICPSCGYDLSSHTPQPDAPLLCPECGGAWPPTENV